MRGFIFVLEKKNKTRDLTSHIKKILLDYNGIENIYVRSSKNNTDLTSFYTFNNEGAQLNSDYGPFDFGVSGNFLIEEHEVFENLILKKDKNKYISSLGGIYSLAMYHNDNLIAWNNVTRVQPIYWTENNDRIVVGTKAILVHLVSLNSWEPEYDTGSMISFLNNGFFADESTPFKNINVLQNNSAIYVEDCIVKIEAIDNFSEQLYLIKPDKNLYDDLTNLFLESFSYLKKLNMNLKTGLTGGKDSRLIVAALNYLGIDFETHTTGFESTPDVIVAQMIAKQLGVDHKYNEPAKSKEHISFDLFTRTVNSIKNTEGMLFSYENIAANKPLFNQNLVTLGGQGGENLRGGYSRNRSFKDVNEVEKYILNSFTKYQDLFVDNRINKYKHFLMEEVKKDIKKLRPNDILNSFYLKYRTGRWSGSSVPYYTITRIFFAPLFENNLVKMAHSIDSSYGTNDKLIYNILIRIAPELVDIPFANDRWNFEKKHPIHRYDLNNWIRRTPIQNTTKLSGFNWRKNLLITSHKELWDTIFSKEQSIIFEIISKEKLLNLFKSPSKTSSYYDTFLWSLYTVCVLTSNKWYRSESLDQYRTRIKIEVPKKSHENKLPNVLIETKHIPNRYIISKNVNLVINHLDDYSSLLSWNVKDNSRIYLQLFDKDFKTPPSPNKFEDLEKLYGNKVKIFFEIEKTSLQELELEVYFIQYSDSERVESIMKRFTVESNRMMVGYEVELAPNAEQYKIAIKILDSLKEGKIQLNQLRIEHYS